jgi:phosphate transport system substrate-binding protein
MMKQNVLIAAALSLTMVACAPYDRSGESMTRGSVRAGIDESYTLMIQSQVEVFANDYPDAKVEAVYKPEGEVIEDLMNDSIQAAVITRALTEDEMAYFRSRQKLPESVRIATDGVALIVHPDNPDTVFTLPQVNDLFTGKISTWSQLREGRPEKEIRIVFDNNRSSNARFISERFLGGGAFPANCFAVHSNAEVMEYVKSNPEAIGVMSVSWISDREDSTSQGFLRQIKVVGISDTTNKERPELARKPYQAYIYDQSYPLRRDVYVIRTSPKISVGTGFASFLRGDRGQLVIHKMGMVADEQPSRVIRIKE